MRKEGTDESNAQPSDFLCDYCGSAWDDSPDSAMIEGHKGSLICAKCLTVAYRQVILAGNNSAHEGYSCTMCLLTKAEPAWESPATAAVACKWCINRAATLLSKDPDCAWSKPV